MKAENPSLVIIVSRFPFPLEKGDKLRAYYQIKELSKHFNIHLISISDIKVRSEHIQELQHYCSNIQIIPISAWTKLWNLAMCLFSDKPFQIGYFYSVKGQRKIDEILQKIKPNFIYAQLVRTTEYVKHYHACPKTLDYMDALSKGMERRISKAPFYARFIYKSETRRLRKYERTIFDYFEHHTIISDQDRDLIFHPNNSRIECIPNGISDSFFNPVPVQKNFDLVFVGNLNYSPNIEAVKYVVKNILPLKPDLTFLIAGADPHSSIVRLSKQNKNIELAGWVDDIRFAYCQGRIFIAPMMIGTGLQNKLLEAMALGIPSITSNLANNALKAIDGESILIGDNEDSFKSQIELLLSDRDLYQNLSKNAQEFIKLNFSWEKSCDTLNSLIKS